MVSSTVVLILALSLLVTAAAVYIDSISHKPELPQVPAGTAITYDGTFRLAFMKPPSQQDIMEQVFYLEKAEHNYRLIFQKVSIPKFTNGTQVRVVGILVVPSSWSRPTFSFDGDIYVQNIIEV